MITYLLTPGGSGNGINDALKRMGCPRRAWYDEQREAKPLSIGKGGALCGTIFHAFVEIYTTTSATFDVNDVEFILPEGVEMPLDFHKELLEARRMFAWYRNKFSPTLGGSFDASEKFFGLDGFTARLDAIYTLPEHNDLNIPAGRYIVDYKCLSKFGDADARGYQWSPQAAWYLHIARTCGEALDGVVFLCCIKTKEPRAEIVLAKEWSEEALNDLIAKMKEKSSQTRTYQCKTTYDICPYIEKCLGE